MRTVTFNSPTFSLNGSNLYVSLTSSNGLGVTVVMNGSNNPTGGPSRSNPALRSTVGRRADRVAIAGREVSGAGREVIGAE